MSQPKVKVSLLNWEVTSVGQFYSAVQNVFSSSCFMKQKYQIQMGIAQCKNVATPLNSTVLLWKLHTQKLMADNFWAP